MLIIRLFQFFCLPGILCGLLLSPLAQAHASAQASNVTRNGLFGSREIKSTQMVAFKKWNGMLTRSKKDMPPTVRDQANNKQAVKCRYDNDLPCRIARWQDALLFLKDKSADKQIAEINVLINKSPYITDIVNWGVPDYWETLHQFMGKNGDCEDYAIAKYMSLKELGFKIDQMRIVVVQDTSLDIPHAVLVVSYQGNRFVLDNQISYVAREKAVLHYKPLYSINENAWWLHRM